MTNSDRTTGGCICRNLTWDVIGMTLEKDGVLLAAYHRDCPVHGYTVVSEKTEPLQEDAKTLG